MNTRKSQSGVTIIEFTLLATAIFLVLFSIIEMGRYVYSLQSLNEITRKAARLGVVCHVSDQNDIATLVVQGHAPAGFTAENLSIQYLNQTGGIVTLNSGMGETEYNELYATIKFVRASISNYQYEMLGFLSFLTSDGWIQFPAMETILPVESLGVIRPTVSHPESRHTNC